MSGDLSNILTGIGGVLEDLPGPLGTLGGIATDIGHVLGGLGGPPSPPSLPPIPGVPGGFPGGVISESPVGQPPVVSPGFPVSTGGVLTPVGQQPPVAVQPVAGGVNGTGQQVGQGQTVSPTLVPKTIMMKGFVDAHGNVHVNPRRKPRMNPMNPKATMRAARRLCKTRDILKKVNACMPTKECAPRRASCSTKKRRR